MNHEQAFERGIVQHTIERRDVGERSRAPALQLDFPKRALEICSG
jgi:hypothetical protein